MMMRAFIAFFLVSFFGHAQYNPQAEIPQSRYKTSDLVVKPIEDFGGKAFYEAFYSCLEVTPQGDGTSIIVDKSNSGRFSNSFVDNYFVGFRIHKNPNTHPSKNKAYDYYPGIMGCRYAKVVKVLSANSLLVDFEFNGGNEGKPTASLNASGEFFFDNKEAIKRAIEDPNRPEVLLFKEEQTYVSIGAWNAKINLDAKPLFFKSTSTIKRSNIKISAEDAFTLNKGGGLTSDKNMEKWFVTSGPLLELNQGSNDCLFQNINILATTYMAPRADDGYAYSIFNYDGGQCTRTIGLENCNTQAEKESLAKQGIKLPKGANWVGPNFGYFSGGGSHNEKDITGYQVIRQYNSKIHAATPYSIKNNDGAGNFQEIVGKSAQERSEVVEIVEGLKIGVSGTGKYNGKNGEVLKTKVSFHADNSTYKNINSGKNEAYGNRLIKIEDDATSWYMLANQYWTGGTSAGITEPITVFVEGFEFRMGNNGDWRPLMGYKNPETDNWSIENAIEARMFNAIPKKGDQCNFKVIEAKQAKSNTRSKGKKNQKNEEAIAYTWDITVQIGDQFGYKGATYTVTQVNRRGGNGHALKGWNPSKDGLLFGYGMKKDGSDYGLLMHLNEVVFDKELPTGLNEFEMLCTKSNAEVLLDGKPREAILAYDRDFNGHCMYNRRFVNQLFVDAYFKGYFRTTGDMKTGSWQDLWNFPRIRHYENVEHSGGGQHWAKCIKFRYDLEGNEKYRYTRIIGGKMAIDNTQEPEEFAFKNRPVGMDYFKLTDPIMLDEMGFNQQQDFAWGNMQVMLTKGQKFNLSGTTHNAGITLSGNGTYVLDKIKIQSNFGKPAKLVLDLSKEGIVVEADGASIEELIIKNTADVDVSKSKVDFRNSTVEKTRISMKQKEQVLPCQGFQINGECITEDDKNKRKK